MTSQSLCMGKIFLLEIPPFFQCRKKKNRDYNIRLDKDVVEWLKQESLSMAKKHYSGTTIPPEEELICVQEKVFQLKVPPKISGER